MKVVFFFKMPKVILMFSYAWGQLNFNLVFFRKMSKENLKYIYLQQI